MLWEKRHLWCNVKVDQSWPERAESFLKFFFLKLSFSHMNKKVIFRKPDLARWESLSSDQVPQRTSE